MSETTSPLSAAGEWRRGWSVVAAAFIGMGVGAGLHQYVSSLFIRSLEAEFGWARDEIAGAAAIGLLGALSAPFIGMIADRIGVMRMAVSCLLLVALAYIGLASMTGELWQFMACIALIAFAAPGSASLVFSRAVNGWFTKSRGMALGVMAAGLSVATFATTPVLREIIAEQGFRMGYLTLAGLAGILGVAVMLAALRGGPKGSTANIETHAAPEGDLLREAVRKPVFWFLALAMLCVNAASTGILTQIAPLLSEKGLSEAVATLVSVYALSVLTGRLIIGISFDRVEAKWIAALVTIGGALGFLLLTNIAPAPNYAIACVILIGLMQGAEGDALAYFVARLFGLRAYSRIYGVFFTISILGSAIGIFGYGRLYVMTQNYNLALMISVAVLAIAVTAYLLLPSFRRTPPVASAD